MAIANGSITVGTVATLVTHAGVNPGEVHISNLDNTDTIFVGGASVAVNSGHALPKAQQKTSPSTQDKASSRCHPKPVT